MRASRGLLLLPALLLLAVGLLFLQRGGGHEPVPNEVLHPRPDAASSPAARAEVAPRPGLPARVAPGASRTAPVRGGEREEPAVLGRVVDASGAPLPRAMLEVRALDPRRAHASPILARGVTDAEGAFRVPVQSDAAWLVVTALSPGHARGAAWSPGRGVFVEIVCTESSPLAVLALDDDGRRVAGAAVEVRVGRTTANAETDAQGQATFSDLPAGAASILAVAPEGRAEGSTRPVALDPSRSTTAVVWLAATVRVGGRVVEGATGLPIAGAEVHVARPGQSTPAGPTAPDGTFEPVLAGPPGQEVTIAVRAEGYLPVLQALPLVPTDAVLQTEIRLGRAQPWKGRVVDAGGRAVEGARVTTTDDGIHGRPAPVALTDAHGAFQLPPPSPPAPGRQVVLLAEGEAGTAALALRPGHLAPLDLVLVLGRGARVHGRVLDATGQPLPGSAVRLDPSWRALTDRRAPGNATSRLLAMNATGRSALQAPTAADGTFEIFDVPDGVFRLRLLRGGRQVVGEEPFEIREGLDVDLGAVTFGEGLEVSGRILASDGRPLPGVDVSLSFRSGGPLLLRAATDADGAFVIRGAPIGPATLSCRHPMHLPLRVTVDVGGLESRALDLQMEAGARIEGVVRDGEKPYRGVFVVELESMEGRHRRTPRTTHRSSDGRFVREGVPDGAWRVRIRTPDGRRASTPDVLDVDTGGRWAVTLDLEEGATLEGVVTTASGAAVSSARVVLIGLDDGRRRHLKTDAKGHYLAVGLPGGATQVTAEGEGGARVEETIDLLAGTHERLDLALERSGAVDVEVEDESARPLAGAIVLARRPYGSTLRPAGGRTPRTDAAGHTRLADLPLGKIEVVARTIDGREARGTVEITSARVARLVLAVRPID